jgi:hypothetical protein
MRLEKEIDAMNTGLQPLVGIRRPAAAIHGPPPNHTALIA